MIVRVQADTKNYDANLAKASKTLDQFAKSNLSMGGVVKQATSALTGMAASMFSVTAAIGAAQKVVSDMVRINKEFEQGTATLASIIGKSRDEITALTNQAKQLGATTRYTAMQITELQTNLARLGFTQQEILNSTTAVQALATATGADLGEAANLAGAALRGFGLNATEMERVTSVMAVSTTKSALSFEKLAVALPIVAPVAKQFGFTIEDTITLLAKLSDAGMDASTAATATRNIFLNMADSSGKLAKALGRPIKSIDDLAPALLDLRNKGIDLAKMLELTDKRSVTAFATFVDGAETMTDLRDSITDCSEAMHDMESKQIDTLQGSITILNSAWEGLMLSFSESTGPIKDVTDGLTKLLTVWTNFRKQQQGGDAAISTFYGGLTAKDKKQRDALIEQAREKGITDDVIRDEAQRRINEWDKAIDQKKKEYEDWQKEHDTSITGLAFATANPGGIVKGVKGLINTSKGKDMAKEIANMERLRDLEQYTIDALTEVTEPVVNPNGTNQTTTTTSTSKGTTPQAKAAQRVEKALDDYATSLSIAAMRKESELDDEKAYKSKELAAHERLYNAYADAYNIYADPKYKAALDEEAKQIKTLSKTIKDLNDAEDAAKKSAEELERAQRDAARLDITILRGLTNSAKQVGWTSEDLGLTGIMTRIKAGIDIPEDEWEKLQDKLNERREQLHMDPIEINFETGAIEKPFQAAKKDMSALVDNVNGAISAFGQLGGAIQQIEDPSAKVAGIIMGAIAEVAGSFAASLKGNFGTWDWIAAAIAGTATMISTIAAIKSATSGAGHYANGGIVPGNSLSGDNVPAMLNSQEIVLNTAQTGNVAGALTGNPMNDLNLSLEVEGTKALIWLNNTNRSLGGSRSFYSERH